MNIFKRALRIGQANAHATLDNLEDPIKMIDQLLRELDEDVSQVTAAVTTQMAVEKRFERELKEAEDIISKRTLQARTAVEQGKDELAKQALLEKSHYLEKRDLLQKNYDQAKLNADTLRQQLSNMKTKVEEMKTQRSVLLAQAQAAKATQKVNDTMAGIGNSVSLNATFARMQEKINQMHDEANAARELADEGASLDAKLAELEKSSKEMAVEDELAALKAELNK